MASAPLLMPGAEVMGGEKVASVMREEGKMSLHYTGVFKVKIRTFHLTRGKGVCSIKKKHFDKDQ